MRTSTIIALLWLNTLGPLDCVGQTGCISGDCQNGFGIYVMENGNRYEGEFKNGTYDGQGNFQYAQTGASYNGRFSNGKRHGHGKYDWGNGISYNGIFKEDKMSGLGSIRFADKSGYVGAFENETYHGSGTFYHSDGSIQSGTWNNGQFVAEVSLDDRSVNGKVFCDQVQQLIEEAEQHFAGIRSDKKEGLFNTTYTCNMPFDNAVESEISGFVGIISCDVTLYKGHEQAVADALWSEYAKLLDGCIAKDWSRDQHGLYNVDDHAVGSIAKLSNMSDANKFKYTNVELRWSWPANVDDPEIELLLSVIRMGS